MVNTPVVSRHAEEAAFLWTLRNRAVTEPHYTLKDLAALDERVEAHLDALKIAGDTGWQLSSENLVNDGPGEMFAVAVVAFSAGDRARMLAALNAGTASAKTRPGLVSALGWLDFVAVSPWIARLLEAKSPLHRSVAIAASAIHRRDPGLALIAAIDDADPTLRARALRAAGELKRHDLEGPLREHLKDKDDACRFWAAWSSTLNGVGAGLATLTSWFERDDAFTYRALQLGLRALTLEDSRQWVSRLAKEPAHERAAVIGAGVVGDPASIPWLIRRLEVPELARLAGEAFSMITGADLSFDDLDRDAPASEASDEVSIEEVLDLNYESNLRWPSPELIQQWWEKNGHAFSPGGRYLTGGPITPPAARKVLVSGKQRQRAAAALELALLDPNQVLYEVRARGGWQQQDVSAWTS